MPEERYRVRNQISMLCPLCGKEMQEPYILDKGEISDGYHTFNELYHHRAVLFSVICSQFPDRSWKSLHHHDGLMYSGMFIVGVDTPAGQATYHYDYSPYWNGVFKNVRILDRAPQWDGHTPDQAIKRIESLLDCTPVIKTSTTVVVDT